MKILLGCDVDPALPAPLTRRPDGNIWQCLDNIDRFLDAADGALPPITWLIRADESVRFCTGRFDSGFLSRRQLWQSLADRGDELGWHFHLMSYDEARGAFGFDADPSWLSSAHHAIGRHFAVRATRTGWDYGSDVLLRRLDALGIVVDFSALPGHIGWQWAGGDKLRVDWSRCPRSPYHPSSDDYQRPGDLALLEVPITPFINSPVGMAKRLGWRLRNGSGSLAGLKNRTRMLTQPWDMLPTSDSPVWAFFFHPEDLDRQGIEEGLRNVRRLQTLPKAEFVVASAVL